MARFRLTATHQVFGRTLKAGTLVCDGTACNAGDFIWTGLGSVAFSNKMVALDAGANTIQAASRSNPDVT